WRAGQCHLPRLRADTAGGQANSRAGPRARHFRRRCGEEGHAEGDRGRRVHHGGRRGRGRPALRRLPEPSPDRPVPGGQPRLVHEKAGAPRIMAKSDKEKKAARRRSKTTESGETSARRKAAPAAAKTERPERRVLVLQGGGALGAYQAGVYEELAKAAL